MRRKKIMKLLDQVAKEIDESIISYKLFTDVDVAAKSSAFTTLVRVRTKIDKNWVKKQNKGKRER